MKKTLAMLLCFTMLLASFAACGGKDDTSTSSKKEESQSQTSTSDPSKTEEEDSKAEGGDTATGGGTVNGEVNQQTYPLTADKVTLSLWYPFAGNIGELSDYNESEFWQWYEEKTNVHIDFIMPAASTEKDSFNLLFASDDMPDMVYTNAMGTNKQSYRGGEDKAIEDGYFIDMAEYLDFAPNYVSWLDHYSTESLGKAVYSDSGKMYGMWGLWLAMDDEKGVMPEIGLSIRKDLLDKVGKDVPTTYDEWYDVLKAFKDAGVEIPFYTSKFGIDVSGEMMAGYGTAPYFYQEDGTVKYGPLDDEYKEYLTMLNKWYSEGLLDPDFPTRNSEGYSPDDEVNLNDKVGAFNDWATRLSETYTSRGATNPDYYLIPVEQPTKGDGTVPHYRSVTGESLLNGGATLFSADSENIELAIRWNDGLYAKDIYLNANYGLEAQEGTVWFAAEDGHRIGDYDFRYSNPDGLSSATVLAKYWSKNPPVRVEAAQIEQADDNKQSAYPLWAKYDAANVIPERITMTAEESTSYSSIYTDIETYVQENNVKFITGSVSLDTYDSYRDTLRDMGIEEAVAFKQAALDRYNQR